MEIVADIRARFTAKGKNCLIGSIPVPKNWTPGPLVVEDALGMRWPTQYKVESRGASNEAKHLDLRALVVSPGGEQSYKVLDKAGQVLPTEAGASFPGMRISARDHANKLYSANIGLEPHPSSQVFRETRKGGELLGPDRFLGYSAYFTTVAGLPDVVLVDMKVQNGNVQDTILHDLFFKSIQIDLPPGWEIMHIRQEPFVNGKTLMAANANGKMHVMRQGAEKEYRFAIYKPQAFQDARNLLDRTGLYVCKHSLEKWSWHNPKTANYLPENVIVPNLNLIFDAYGASGSQIEATLASGGTLASAEMFGPKGPFYPRGSTYGGVTGGVGITAFPGLETLSSGRLVELKALFAVHSMDADRSAGICFVGSNQYPINPMDWKNAIGNIQFIQCGQLINNNEGPWPRSKADQWRYNQVSNAGLLPDYYNGLIAYQPYDFAHLIRGLGPALALAWLVNDPLAKERIATYAAWSRLLLLEIGAGGLAKTLAQAQIYPGKGGLGGREHGWAELAINADYQLATDEKRASIRPWFDVSLTTRQLAQLDSGGWQATYGKPADIINNLIAGTAPKVIAGQAIEFGIDLNGLRATQVSTEDSRIPAMFLKAVAGCRNYHWKPNTDAPHTTLAVRYENINLPAFAKKSDAPEKGFTPETDNYQTYVVPLYALMQDSTNQDALAIVNLLAGSDPLAKLTSQMPFKMNEGAGALLGLLQVKYKTPVDPRQRPNDPQDPKNELIEALIARINRIEDPDVRRAAIARLRAILDQLQ